MGYDYESVKNKIFTDQGQKNFLKIRDHVNKILDIAGAISMAKAVTPLCGNSWEITANIDRMVELKEIKEITNSNVVGQDRIFIKN